MKKLLTLILAAAISLSVFTGCDSKKKADGILEIGIVQPQDHPSLNTIRESFLAEMKALGYVDGENMKVDYQNSQGDSSTLNTICQKFATDKKDLIVAIATPAAVTAAAATSDIPVLFSAVTDPVAAKLVADMDKPGKNVTGTSDYVAVDKILDMALELKPNIKKLGLLYNTGEANSVACMDTAKAYAKSKNIEVVEAAATNTGEVQQAVQSLVTKVDAIFTPTDNTVATAMPIVTELTRKAKIPFFVGADSMVKDGGFATKGIEYTELGKETAKMADRIYKGEKPADIPVKVFSEPNIYFNQTTADAIGIQIPDNLKGDKTEIFK